MLLTALACVACAALIAYFAPSLMTVGKWQLLHPRTALAAWFGAFFLGMALCSAALTLSVGGAVSASVSTPVIEAILLTLGGWLSLALFGALAFFVVSSAAPLVALERVSSATLASIATSREEFASYTLIRFESSDEIAYAVPGGASGNLSLIRHGTSPDPAAATGRDGTRVCAPSTAPWISRSCCEN